MAAPGGKSFPSVALRGSGGVWMAHGPPLYTPTDGFPCGTGKMCRVMTFSADGSLIAYCDGAIVKVVSTATNKVNLQLDLPRTSKIEFSPKNSVLATWEPYIVTKDIPQGTENLKLWDLKTGQLIKAYVHKKQALWCPAWSGDEFICAKNVNNEIHFFENNQFDSYNTKLHLVKVSDFSMPPKSASPHHVSVYVPGSKGQPSFVRVFRYPNFAGHTAAVANKSFFKSDRVDMIWNNKGSALVVLTASDTSAESYYGDQGLHFISTNGESCLVPRPKNGPVYHVEWNPNSTDFTVVYGSMPAKATMFNLKCEAIFDFGTGPRNAVYYNPQGNILALCGFGNLRGYMEFWDVNSKKLISNPKAPDTTNFQWSPDGIHLLTATTSPRLRVGNGYKIWHYTGSLLHESQVGSDEELWEAKWQRFVDGTFPKPQVSYVAVESNVKAQEPEESKSAYLPPHLRNKTSSELSARPKFREAFEPPSNMKQTQAVTNTENMSKSALKNKKRKEAKQRQQEVPTGAMRDDGMFSVQSMKQTAVGSGQAADADTEKRAKNLRKKLQQIQKLKDQQSQGKVLESNQLEKLKSESTLLKELEELSL